MTPLLRVADVARLLAISPRSVRMLAERGQIAHVRPTPGRLAFVPEDVAAYIASRRVTPIRAQKRARR